MAKSKSLQSVQEDQINEVAAEAPLAIARDERHTLMEYLAVVMVFWLFCGLQLVVIRYLLRETTGLYFLFGFLCVTFTVVALIAWLHDCFYREEASLDDTR